jgi:copper chaperone
MSTATYTVKGMTCGHCVNAVTEEITKIDGVTNVDIDLASGLVTIASERDLGADEVREAVDEAGYEVVS